MYGEGRAVYSLALHTQGTVSPYSVHSHTMLPQNTSPKVVLHH